MDLLVPGRGPCPAGFQYASYTGSQCSALAGFQHTQNGQTCRLHFNRAQKYLGLFDKEKNETKHAIESLNDIYAHAAELRQMASFWGE